MSKMRLDKFLKTSRIIKRRTVAKQVAEDNLIKINGKPAKPSTILKVGDIIEISFASSLMKFEVTSFNQRDIMATTLN